MITALDLFSGIGGFAISLEKVGIRTVAFCENDPFCQKVLRARWPRVPVHEDVKELKGEQVGYVDIICGGFPCQDISLAGRRAGLAGERSGLWFEFRRLIDEIRPQWVIVENVAALRSSGLSQVLQDLAALGYNALWNCIPASAVGAPHRRDRIWIVAHSTRTVFAGNRAQPQGQAHGPSDDGHVSDAAGQRQSPARNNEVNRAPSRTGQAGRTGGARKVLLNAGGAGLAPRLPVALGQVSIPERSGGWHPESGLGRMADGISPWAHEPDDVPRVAKGIPDRVKRLKALGNAIVPQVAELIARSIIRNHCIMDAELSEERVGHANEA